MKGRQLTDALVASLAEDAPATHCPLCDEPYVGSDWVPSDGHGVGSCVDEAYYLLKQPLFYIATTNHEALWPRGVILWWAADSCGYSTTINGAGKYTKEQAESICTHAGNGTGNSMIPCAIADAGAVKVVDIDLLQTLIDKAGLA